MAEPGPLNPVFGIGRRLGTVGGVGHHYPNRMGTMACIDEGVLRPLLKEAISMGFEIAETDESAFQRGFGEPRIRELAVERLIAAARSQILIRASEVMPAKTYAAAEPALYWTLEELLRWGAGIPTMASLRCTSRSSATRAFLADSAIGSALQLLAADLLDLGVIVHQTPPRRAR